MKRARIYEAMTFLYRPGFVVFTKHGHVAFSVNEIGFKKVCYHFPHLKERIIAANADIAFLVGRYCYYNSVVEHVYGSTVSTQLI